MLKPQRKVAPHQEGKQPQQGSQRKAQAGGECRRRDAAPQDHQQPEIQQNVQHRGQDIEHHAVPHQTADSQVIVQREKDHDGRREECVNPQISNRQLRHRASGAHQAHQRFRHQKAAGSGCAGDGDDQQAAKAEDAAGLSLPAFAQADGNLHRGTRRDHVGEGKAHDDQRHHQVDRRKGIGADHPADKYSVRHRIERGHRHADHARKSAAGKKPPGHELFINLVVLHHIVKILCRIRR